MKQWLKMRRYIENLRGLKGGEVVVAGWIQDIKVLGKIAFLILRDKTGLVQITLFKKDLKDNFKKLISLNRESVCAFKGKLCENPQSKLGIEIIPTDFEILSPAEVPLPMGVVDKVNVEMDTRIESRYIDLRRKETSAIFHIRSSMIRGVRDALERKGFVEVHTPKIVATATEGGTALFPVEYFEKRAYLNQSPQLFKQILMASSLDKVYEIGPAFRAEEHDTVRHLNEFTSIDIEMAFADDEDVMDILEDVIISAIKRINDECRHHLEVLGMEIDVPMKPFPRISFEKAVNICRKRDIDVAEGEDLSTEALKVIGQEFKSFFFITRWPTHLKPFYAMPCEDNPKFSRSFDLMYREKEVTSGAQRVHNPKMLVERLKECGLNAESFKSYIEAFRYGMPPHAGWGLGAERLLMILTNASNIRECVLFPRDRRRLTP